MAREAGERLPAAVVDRPWNVNPSNDLGREFKFQKVRGALAWPSLPLAPGARFPKAAMDTRSHAFSHDADRGFTLMELIVCLAVFGTLLALAPATYGEWIASQQLANHARLLTETLELARSEAIKHGYRVNVCKSSDGRRCDDRAGWEAGWVMFVDENRDGEIDDDQQIIRREGAAPAQITLAANRPVADYVSYTSLGHARLLSGALQMGTFVVCKPGQDAIKVVLAHSGRARMEKTRERCA